MNGEINLVVLISGFGSNLQAILDAARLGIIPARVCAVVSNKADAYGLERARLAGIPSIAHVYKKDQERTAYDLRLADIVATYRPDWVVLAGWMRILSSAFLERFPNRVVNLHPALPGMFPGTHAIERALEAYRSGQIEHTGVMVHLVPDEGVDNGPVLNQRVVPILPEDTLETLEARVHKVEHTLLVETLKNCHYSGYRGKAPNLRCLRVRSTRKHLKLGNYPHDPRSVGVMAEQSQEIYSKIPIKENCMPKALLSVFDKTGLVEFAGGLASLGWDLIASGGTARLLHRGRLPVTEVADYTGSPEILDGRVKTLHPAIHGGLLARDRDADRAELSQLGWSPIDLVAVNLYPFEATISKPGVTREDAIENIDIGGVALIRAAAKNSDRVTLVCDPQDYPAVLKHIQAGGVPLEIRRQLAVKGFRLTAHYDAAISAYLSGDGSETLTLYPVQALRYGENPHQKAALYSYAPGGTPLGGRVLQGKELSYNNLLDLDAAWRAAANFEKTTIAIVKHLSPCGIASGETLEGAYSAALASDPVSAYGGVVASNRKVDAATAQAMSSLFIECIIAPGVEEEALKILAHKKNLRLVDMPDLKIEPDFELRSITRGVLKQSVDFGDPQDTSWKVVSDRQPTGEEWQALKFAWKACQHVKSNAIVFARGEATVGIGGGQPNRVDCVRIAIERSGEKARGAVMASDAFFPFPDSVELAAKAGITCIVHPGGSIRDAESIAMANMHGIVMVTTGFRHFRH